MSSSNGPYMEHVLDLRLEFALTVDAGPTPRGDRSWAAVRGGKICTTDGQQVASVLPGGGDYIRRNPGHLVADVDMHFVAQDAKSVLFHFTHKGFCHLPKEMVTAMGSVVPDSARSSQGPLTGWNKATGGFEHMVCNTSSLKYRWMNFAVLLGVAELVIGDYGVEAVQYQIFRPTNQIEIDHSISVDVPSSLVLKNIGLLRFETEAPVNIGTADMWIGIKGGSWADSKGQQLMPIISGRDLITRHIHDGVLELNIIAMGSNRELRASLSLDSHGYLHIPDAVMNRLELNAQKDEKYHSKLAIPPSMQEFGEFDSWISIKCNIQSEEHEWMNYSALLGRARFVPSDDGVAAMEFQLFHCQVQD